MQRKTKRKTRIDQRPFLFVLALNNRPIRQALHPVMHIHRHEVELAAFGEHVHSQHGVVFRQSAAYRDARLLVDNLGDAAHDRAGGIAVAVWLAQWVARRKRLVALAAMRFETFADGGVEFFVAVRVDQFAGFVLVAGFAEIGECQAGQLDFLRDTALRLEAFGLRVDRVLVCRAAVAALRSARDEQGFQRIERIRRVRAQPFDVGA